LQQELQPPTRAGSSLPGLDLGEPEGRPGRACLADPDTFPWPQRGNQRVELVRIRLEPAVRSGQCGQPGFLGWQTFRATAVPGRQEIDPWWQRCPHGGVQHRVQRRHGQLVRVVLTLLGPAHRRHRGDQ
jgi:hypothetical protein